jgi:replicative DNA helicase
MQVPESAESGNSLVGVSTGFTDIDEITLGLQKSDLIIIAGRPSMGKSALGFNIIENVAKQTDQTVLLFSMEMSSEQVIRRFIASISNIDIQRIMRGQLKEADWEGIDKALSILSKKNILLDDTPALSPTEVRARARRVKRENPDLALIVIDYIGLMQVPESAESGNSLVGVSTGFTDIDEITLGLQKSDLIIIAGRPSMGKSALGFNIIENVAKQTDQTVLLFSMEMSSEQVIRRFIASISKIDIQRIMRGQLKEADWEGIDKALSILSKKNILLDDTPALSPTEVRARARRVKRENPDLALIVIDYIGLMQVPGRGDNRVQEVSEISRSLKALAKELNVPIIGLSQLNRTVESRPNKRPILADLRDSGAIEQDADVIAFVYRHEYYDESDLESRGQAEINIAKQRNGPTKTTKLAFRREIATFQNLAKSDRFPGQFYDENEDD